MTASIGDSERLLPVCDVPYVLTVTRCIRVLCKESVLCVNTVRQENYILTVSDMSHLGNILSIEERREVTDRCLIVLSLFRLRRRSKSALQV